MQHLLRGAVAVGIALGTAGCDKEDPVTVEQQATVRFVNAIPGTTNLNFTFAGQQQGQPVAFQGTSECLRLNTSSNAFGFNTGGTSGVSRTFTQALTPGGRFTVFATGTAANPTFLAVEDQFTAPSSGGLVRIVNATGATGTFDVFLTAPNATLGTASATALSGNAATSFLSVPAGQTQLRLRAPGSTAVAFTGTPFTVNAGQVQTIVVGPPTTTGGAFNAFAVAACP